MVNIPEEALEAHCRRVAGWATQAAQNDYSSEELSALEKAALLHHYPPLLLRPEALTNIASDLQIEIAGTGQPVAFTDLCLTILQSFHNFDTQHVRAMELARILESGDQFDEQFELQAWDPLPAGVDSEVSTLMPQLRLVDAASVLRAGQTLPVFPTVSQRAMRLLSTEDVSFEQLEAIVQTDQVLATELLKFANSALSGPRQRITSLSRAIGHIGVTATTRVICAACLRPVFASRNLFALWNHSIEAAEVAETLALLSERIDPGEAFLAGLVHDIGRLAFSLLSCDYQTRTQRLLDHGCPPLLIERALAGISHPEVGAELLRGWALPPHIADAVKFHHGIEETAEPLAALLYATEFWTMSDEDLPSSVRLERALQILDLPMQLVLTPRPHATAALNSLRFPVSVAI